VRYQSAHKRYWPLSLEARHVDHPARRLAQLDDPVDQVAVGTFRELPPELRRYPFEDPFGARRQILVLPPSVPGNYIRRSPARLFF
jgi:hypothetical protein